MPAALQPRWSRRAPSEAEADAFLADVNRDAASRAWSYRDVGASRDDGAHPPGYNLDHNRERLGAGEAEFEAACAALRAWRMFPAMRAAVATREVAAR